MKFHAFSPATELRRGCHPIGARGMLAQLCSAAHGQPGPSAYEVFLAFAIPFVSSSHVLTMCMGADHAGLVYSCEQD